MDCPFYKASFNVFSWLFILAFLHQQEVAKGTGFDVFNQEPSREKYYPDYRIYHNLSRLNECIHDLVTQFPDVLDTQIRFRSRWGQTQYALHFTDHKNTKTKQSSQENSIKTKTRVLLVYGEHSSEFLPVESMLYLLKNLTGGLNSDFLNYDYNFTRFVLDHIDLYLIAMINPDGRTIIEKTSNYCWKKTASQADLNSHGSSATPEYDSRVLVEPECRVLTAITKTVAFDAVVFFHSGKKEVFIPMRGNSKMSTQSTSVPDFTEVYSMASLFSLRVTQISQNGHSDGESLFSYIAFKRQVPFTFLVSMWGDGKVYRKGSNCFSKYNPISSELEKTLQTIQPMYGLLFQNLVHWKRGNFKILMEKARLEQKSSSSSLMYYRVFLFLILVGGAVFVIKFKMPLGWRLIFRRQRRIVSLRSLSSAFSFSIISEHR